MRRSRRSGCASAAASSCRLAQVSDRELRRRRERAVVDLALVHLVAEAPAAARRSPPARARLSACKARERRGRQVCSTPRSRSARGPRPPPTRRAERHQQAPGGTVGAPGSGGPSAIASWNSALSRTERVSTPLTASPCQASSVRRQRHAPALGLQPEQRRSRPRESGSSPPPSPASAAPTRPAATAAALPPLEPPGLCCEVPRVARHAPRRRLGPGERAQLGHVASCRSPPRPPRAARRTTSASARAGSP